MAQALSKRTGQPVDPEPLSVQLTRDIPQDEFEAAEAQECARLAERFANVEPKCAVILAARLFESLRPYLAGSENSDDHYQRAMQELQFHENFSGFPLHTTVRTILTSVGLDRPKN